MVWVVVKVLSVVVWSYVKGKFRGCDVGRERIVEKSSVLEGVFLKFGGYVLCYIRMVFFRLEIV